MIAKWEFYSGDSTSFHAAHVSALRLLRRNGRPGCDLDACAIVIGELLANAVRHGPRASIRLTLDWSKAQPVVAVSDTGRGFSINVADERARTPPPLDTESGRGLFLVWRLAGRPQVAVDVRGCTVSVRLPVDAV